MVDEAVAFAMKAHEGTFRKGTKVPYIVHPLETAVIVSMMSWRMREYRSSSWRRYLASGLRHL